MSEENPKTARKRRLQFLDFSRPAEGVDFFGRTRQFLEEGLSDRVASAFAASVFTIARPDDCCVLALGKTRNDEAGLPIGVHSRFDIASVSKVFGTWALFARLCDRGWIDFETPLKSFFPDLSAQFDEVKMAHLLSHTAGFVWWKPFWERFKDQAAPRGVWEIPAPQKREWLIADLMQSPPEAKPGTRMVYSDLSFLWLGLALEVVTGEPLEKAVQHHVFDSLEVNASGYREVTSDAPHGINPEVVATEVSDWRGGLVQGQVHDDNTWALGGVAGHAGIFSNVTDLAVFVRALLKEHWIGPETLKKSWTPFLLNDGTSSLRTLGWDLRSGASPSSGNSFSNSTVGHTGFTGTSLWIDLEKGIGATLFSNRVHPSRLNDRIKFFRPLFHDALLEDLHDWLKE